MSSPKRILVADDEPRIVESMCHALQDAGFETAQAFGGEEAIRWLATSLPPDLVICDHRMPGTDGAAVRSCMLEQPQLAGVPFILMSSSASNGSEFADWPGGPITFENCLTKPFGPQELVLYARRALGYGVKLHD